MILLTTSLTKAKDFAGAIEAALNEPVVVAASLHEAATQLQTQEFSVAVFDQLLLEAEPDDGDAALRNLGAAFPVYMNFAVTGERRLQRDLRSALHRRNRELAMAREEAARSLRSEMKDQITVLLMSCELALQVPDLSAAKSKISGAYETAKLLRDRLDCDGKR